MSFEKIKCIVEKESDKLTVFSEDGFISSLPRLMYFALKNAGWNDESYLCTLWAIDKDGNDFYLGCAFVHNRPYGGCFFD